MKVTVERIPESQVLLNIEIDPERVQSSVDQAYKRLAPKARVPGFRPGKAPRAVLERHFGRESVLHDALDRLVPAVVQEAIDAEAIDMIARPDMEITSLEPVTIKATVPVRPTVDLGEYRALRVEQETPAFDPADVDSALEELRKRHATIEPVERPIEDGDVITLDISAISEELPLLSQENQQLTVTEADTTNLPGLYSRLLGLGAGETRVIEVLVPEDADNPMAGKAITYTVTINEVKQQILPELDDELAQEVGDNFPTLASLRERVESDLRARQQTEQDRALEDAALAKLVESAVSIDFPPQVVEREIERMLRDQGVPGNDRKTFEQFLRRAGLSEDRLREEFRPHAAERVRRSLALEELRQREGLTVTPEEVAAELEAMAGVSGQAEQVRTLFDTEEGRRMIEGTLLSRKTVERLRQIARGEAPPVKAEDTASERPAPAAPAAPDADRQDSPDPAASAPGTDSAPA